MDKNCPSYGTLVARIGIYAAGLAIAHGAGLVTYTDRSHTRRTLAESLGATPMYAKRPEPVEPHDIVVEASSSARGLRAAIRSTAPGGFVTAVGYYVKTNTGTPLMHMYANDITLHIGVSSPRATMPNLLEWMAANDFAADRVTTLLADWDDAPRRLRRQHNQARAPPRPDPPPLAAQASSTGVTIVPRGGGIHRPEPTPRPGDREGGQTARQRPAPGPRRYQESAMQRGA